MTKNRLITLAREHKGLILTLKNSPDQAWINSNKLLEEGKIPMSERFHDGSGYRMVAV